MDEYTVSFRISGVGLQPSEISEKLKLSPDTCYIPHSKEYYVDDKTEKHAISDTGIWTLDCKISEEISIPNKIENLLEVLYPLKEELDNIKKSGYKLDFFCGYFSYDGQPGISLESDLLSKIGSLGINFELCLYNCNTYQDNAPTEK